MCTEDRQIWGVNYKEYLESTEWEIKRRHALQLADHWSQLQLTPVDSS